MSQYAGDVAAFGMVEDGQSLWDNPFAVGTGFGFLLPAAIGATAAPPAWRPGAGWNQLRNSWHTRVLPYNNVGVRNIYGEMGGTTQLVFGFTAASIYADMRAEADLAHANGFEFVIAWTVTASDDITGAGNESVRLALNALLLANGDNAFDLVIDLCPTPGVDLDDFAGPCFTDDTHWSDLGRDTALDLSVDPIVTLINAD